MDRPGSVRHYEVENLSCDRAQKQADRRFPHILLEISRERQLECHCDEQARNDHRQDEAQSGPGKTINPSEQRHFDDFSKTLCDKVRKDQSAKKQRDRCDHECRRVRYRKLCLEKIGKQTPEKDRENQCADNTEKFDGLLEEPFCKSDGGSNKKYYDERDIWTRNGIQNNLNPFRSSLS